MKAALIIAASLTLAVTLAACTQEAEAPAEVQSPDKPAQSETQSETNAQPKEAAVDKTVVDAPKQVQVNCAAEETTIFSCKAGNGKRIAVCAADGAMEYRYGLDNPELTVAGTRWASATYSGGGESQIAFSNGDTDYIVFSRIVRTNFKSGEPNNPAISDGVIAVRGKNVLALQTCDDPGVEAVDVTALDSLFPSSEELFTEETGRADPS